MPKIRWISSQGGVDARASTQGWLEARRRVACAILLLAVPSFLAVRALIGGGWNRFALLFFASHLVGAAALTRRSPLAQVVGRGIAWKMCVAQGWVFAVRALAGDLRPIGALLVITPALALVIARPLLDTAEARAAFAPRASRSAFLAAATASMASAMYAASLVSSAWAYASCPIGAALTVLTAALVAQAAAVLHMRAWGVVLGAATACGVVLAMLAGVANPMFTAITAMPGVALVGALGAAWARERTTTQSRALHIG